MSESLRTQLEDGEVEIWSGPGRRVSALENESLILTSGERVRLHAKGTLAITSDRLLFDNGDYWDGPRLKHIRAVYLQQAGRRLYLLAISHDWGALRYRLRAADLGVITLRLNKAWGETHPGAHHWVNAGFEEPPARKSDW